MEAQHHGLVARPGAIPESVTPVSGNVGCQRQGRTSKTGRPVRAARTRCPRASGPRPSPCQRRVGSHIKRVEARSTFTSRDAPPDRRTVKRPIFSTAPTVSSAPPATRFVSGWNDPVTKGRDHRSRSRPFTAHTDAGFPVISFADPERVSARGGVRPRDLYRDVTQTAESSHQVQSRITPMFRDYGRDVEFDPAPGTRSRHWPS